jgi:hypothetical protein
MDKRQKYSAALLLVLIAGTAWLKLRGHPSLSVPASTGADAESPFLAPYGWGTPGISDDPLTINGGPPFSSVVNVNVNPSYLGSLSQQFIPMFGFVGIGERGAAPSGSPSAGGQISAPSGLAPGQYTSSNYTSTGEFSRNFIQSQTGASAQTDIGRLGLIYG